MSLLKKLILLAVLGMLMLPLVAAQPPMDSKSSDHNSDDSDSNDETASALNQAFIEWTFDIELGNPEFVDLEYGVLPELHYGPHCPHENFLRKHVMTFGSSSLDAADFTEIFRFEDDWTWNHVLSGETEFHVDDDRFCVNTNLLPVFLVKKLPSGEITSRLVHHACRMFHSLAHGHMERKLMCRVSQEELQLSTGPALFQKMANMLSGRED